MLAASLVLVSLVASTDGLVVHAPARTGPPRPHQLASRRPHAYALPVLASRIACARTPPPAMQELPFWENGARARTCHTTCAPPCLALTPIRPPSAVGRFMKFGITSVTGLIAGLLSPFSAFLRTPTLAAIGGTLLVGFVVFIYLTLSAMQGTPEMAPVSYQPQQQQQQPSSRQSAGEKVDPTMRKMLEDIYGE